jgi:hypothetical protein
MIKTIDKSKAKKAIKLEVEFDTNRAKRISKAIGKPKKAIIFRVFILSRLKA